MAQTDRPLVVEHDFFRSVAFDGLTNLVGAAIVYFFLIMILLARTAPLSFLPLLLIQKGIYAAFLLALFFRLRAKTIPAKYYNLVMNLILALCLSSGLITAACGISSRFGTYSIILILACSLMDISYLWAIFHWLVIWVVWYAVTVSSVEIHLGDEFAKLVGIQLIAWAAMSLRLRLYKAQFRTLTELADALSESEQVRAHLDDEVDRRTELLQAAYEELRLSVQERERMADEREKLQEQLLQSQKMESLGRLAGGVAHDFNNLLTVITGSVEMARMSGSLGSEVDEYLQESVTAATRAAELTGQLLAFSRKKVMEVKAFGIQETVRDSLKLVERLLGEDIELQVCLDCPLAIIEGDPSQFQQVILNLVVNARDAMPQGGTLGIGLSKIGNEVVLGVSDTGEGIAAELYDKVFEPFFTTKMVGKGTGLGLSTVHGIVSMHKGRISIDSVLGEGTRFLVHLPIADSQSEDTISERKLRAPNGTGNILLVEDDSQVRNLAVRVLARSGYEVRAFENAKSALSSLDLASDCDLLLTDVVMPGMDGGKLAEAVRRRLPDLPVLFMSGYTDDRLSSFDVLRRDNCGFLAKPFSPVLLQTAVADILSRRPIRAL